MTTVHLTTKSANAKTGPIPVSTTSRATCPPTCGMRAGCYAASGPLAIHWAAVTSGTRGTDWGTFCSSVAAMPDGQLWRHNQAGDLPGDGTNIDTAELSALVRANRGKRGFTYTHYTPTGANANAIRRANADGFTVNLSADNLEQVDALADLDIGPVVCVLPKGTSANIKTRAGRTVVICPATIRDDVSCATCQLCQRQRKTIIGFPAHGSGTRRADAVARIINIKPE